jgi:hypothetical protein
LPSIIEEHPAVRARKISSKPETPPLAIIFMPGNAEAWRKLERSGPERVPSFSTLVSRNSEMPNARKS